MTDVIVFQVDVPLERWLERFPELKVQTRLCDSCGTEMRADRPFLMKGYAGLRAPKCRCGKNKRTCMSMVTTTPEETQKWVTLLKT